MGSKAANTKPLHGIETDSPMEITLGQQCNIGEEVLFCLINVSLHYNGGSLPDIFLLTPMLLPSGNPFRCHEKVLSLQPTKQ